MVHQGFFTYLFLWIKHLYDIKSKKSQALVSKTGCVVASYIGKDSRIEYTTWESNCTDHFLHRNICRSSSLHNVVCSQPHFPPKCQQFALQWLVWIILPAATAACVLPPTCTLCALHLAPAYQTDARVNFKVMNLLCAHRLFDCEKQRRVKASG